MARILKTLPEWFGREEANAEYIHDAETIGNVGRVSSIPENPNGKLWGNHAYRPGTTR